MIPNDGDLNAADCDTKEGEFKIHSFLYQRGKFKIHSL
jgi:hypothetical protein